MDNDNKDTIDLIPYYKLVRRTLSKIGDWFNRKILFILIVFIALLGFKAYKQIFSGDQFKYVGLIDREFVSNDDLSKVLKSTARNIDILNEKENGDIELNSEDLLVRLDKLEYEIVLNLKDEIVNNSNRKIDSIQIDFDVPMKVSLFSHDHFDSIGLQFINYLNDHPYISKLRKEHLLQTNKTREELIDKINFIDSIIHEDENESYLREAKNIYFNIEKDKEIYNLVKYKNELIQELTRIELELEKTKNADIFIVDGFGGPEKIEKVDFSSSIFFLKYFIFSCLIVFIASWLLKKLFKR